MIIAVTGFTIVELLSVTVVIAVLAAIWVVAYTGLQSRARDTPRLKDVRAIAWALEAYRVIHRCTSRTTNSALLQVFGIEGTARPSDAVGTTPWQLCVGTSAR